MNINEIQQRLHHIKSLEDFEPSNGIHRMDLLVVKGREEINLYRDFIKFVAQVSSQESLSSAAMEILKVRETGF